MRASAISPAAAAAPPPGEGSGRGAPEPRGSPSGRSHGSSTGDARFPSPSARWQPGSGLGAALRPARSVRSARLPHPHTRAHTQASCLVNPRGRDTRGTVAAHASPGRTPPPQPRRRVSPRRLDSREQVREYVVSIC
ncbi:Hypothetical predicted protein [Podarcis lilfordi]|uniref:Uncharacterized protein n=1 Tax=Podarcis lilfordi TaxID=74358 RepID=A0AA35LK85_9SAUR|nr:Hypothetical predicted protein [Podarcis lilfordi]